MSEQFTAEQLSYLQEQSLDRKIMITQTRILEWHSKWNGNVFISFSGGKDSTVLLDLARRMYPDIPAVFFNTGLEYPEIRKFALAHEGVEEIRPLWGASRTNTRQGPKERRNIQRYPNILRLPAYLQTGKQRYKRRQKKHLRKPVLQTSRRIPAQRRRKEKPV